MFSNAFFVVFFCLDVSFNLYDQNVDHAVPCSNSHRVRKTGFTIQNSQFGSFFFFFFTFDLSVTYFV